MDQCSFIGGLQDIRMELVSTRNSMETLRRRMVGSRPEDSGNAKNPQSEATIASLILEIRSLSAEINKRVSEHLEIVGTDQSQPAKTAVGY